MCKPYDVNGIRYYPLPDAYGSAEYGKASWYGKEFHDSPTSSGEICNMYGKTVAHKLLPLDTVVKVTTSPTGRPSFCQPATVGFFERRIE